VADDEMLNSLRRLTGQPDSNFREGQREAIIGLVRDKQRVVVVQRTGWGKSAVYFIATEMLRKQGFGPTIIISPLLVLMDNQITAASRLGLRAATINSANKTTVKEVVNWLSNDEIDVLLISPERLANPQFRDQIVPLIGRKPSLLVVDEVHCISDWGHDFRPDYQRIAQVLKTLPAGIPILGTTATANDRVVQDVRDQLGAAVSVVRGALRRESLTLGVVDAPKRANRLVWIDKYLTETQGSGIIYCLTVRDVEKVAAYLLDRGHVVAAYHADMTPEERQLAIDLLVSNSVRALVASVALGMGYDKPDVRFVIHYQLPGSVVTYYQQVGRAGRAIPHADAILMHGEEDSEILDFFTSTAFPSQQTVAAVLGVLDKSQGPVSVSEMQESVNLKMSEIESTLKQLEVAGVVEREGYRAFTRTLTPYVYPTKRVAELAAVREQEKQQMRDYLTTNQCRMVFLSSALDDSDLTPCGKCDNCSGKTLTANFSSSDIAAANKLLRSGYESIQPRLKTAGGTSIPKTMILETGRALSRWRDGGYGDLVASGKQVDGRFSDELVTATAAMYSEWKPQPQPTWVSCVPSSSSGNLVSDFAGRLAAALGLPFHDVITKTRQTNKQKSMRNSSHQASNVSGAFAIQGKTPKGPVLLVDDLVDSRWTFTELGKLLRSAGVSNVFPLALAVTTSKD
jgi:ATP-dependent DNA helicase RecQ